MRFVLGLAALAASVHASPPYYWRYAQSASPGNDLTSLGDVARDESAAACNGYNSSCAGFDNDGVLKSKIAFPLEPAFGMDLYVKLGSNNGVEPTLPISVFPLPSMIKNGTQTGTLSPDAFQFTSSTPSGDLQAAFERYTSIIFAHRAGAGRTRGLKRSSQPKRELVVVKEQGSEPSAAFFAITGLEVTVANLSVALQLDVDETYSLYIPTPGSGKTTVQATLTANTVYGAYRGLETFAQLVRYDFDLATYRADWLPILINDEPQFPYRGLLIDCSRHYQPVPFLIQALDSMAAAKLNVLHLHLVDSQAWPVESRAYPDLWRASWTPQERYTLDDLAYIVEEARLRGINVLPEFDTPGHSQAVCVGYPEACPSSTCWTPLNPIGNTSFDIIQGVFSEWTDVFPLQYYHAGGDEVNGTCWTATPAIAAWMAANGYANGDVDGVYEYMVKRVDDILASMGKYSVRWEEVWNHFGTALPKQTVIHVWLDHATLLNVTANGYRAILSDSLNLYLDHTATNWTSFYDDDPLEGIPKGSSQASFVMGVESAMWGELADGSDLLQTIWPRAAASAERGWSVGATTSADPDVLRRLNNFRCLLLQRGFPAAPVNNAQARTAPPFPGSCVWQ